VGAAGVLALVSVAAAERPAGGTDDAQPGRSTFAVACAHCHGADGKGGERGPDILARLRARDDASLALLVRDGLPAAGMPSVALPDGELHDLIAYLRTLRDRESGGERRVTLHTADGLALSGRLLNPIASDVQLLADDGRIHLLRAQGAKYRRVTSETDWPTYHGQLSGNRYSPLAQIDASNVSRLVPRWVHALPGTGRLETTPVVVDGIMYVTAVNECHALDAGNGREIWLYRRPRSTGLAGDAAGGINRGVAVSGRRVFMVTDNAHVLALDRFTGALLWDTEMADSRLNYGATSAPLAVRGLVIAGPSGGDEGVRGFVVALDEVTGREVWRFWTVPARGEPGAETWKGRDIDHPCATAWFTGTYDADSGTLFWPTGNPCPDYDGSERAGDNLYSDSVLALDTATGRLGWHFQYTPHDVWDWDAEQPAVLVDADWQGKPRHLLLQANRNGFFYVLDRATGALVAATPFVRKLTWAREIGADGRPVLLPDREPVPEGRIVCPSVEGATNWFSTAFHPALGLYYVQALESCTLYTRGGGDWQAGKSYYRGTTQTAADQESLKVLRAIDIRTGAIAWERPQAGRARSWGGVLATAGSLVFYADDGGSLAAVEAATGAPRWQFPANAAWKASPMTYAFDGRQYVAIAAGPAIVAFGLPD